jgi:hypothetical protein
MDATKEEPTQTGPKQQKGPTEQEQRLQGVERAYDKLQEESRKEGEEQAQNALDRAAAERKAKRKAMAAEARCLLEQEQEKVAQWAAEAREELLDPEKYQQLRGQHRERTERALSLAKQSQQTQHLEAIDDDHQRLVRWLMERFEEGVHYGIPPGCEVSPGKRPNPKQWRIKPMLYEAGALRTVSIFKLRVHHSLDKEVMEVMGIPGMIVYKCELLSRDGELVATGVGAYEKNENSKMKGHARIQVAQKRALVDAVHNGFPQLGELFTRDLADDTENDTVNPDKASGPPSRAQILRACSLIQDSRLPKEHRDTLKVRLHEPQTTHKRLNDILLICKRTACGSAEAYKKTVETHAPLPHESLDDDGNCKHCGFPSDAGDVF